VVRRSFADTELRTGDAFGLFRSAMRDTARWRDASVTDHGALCATAEHTG
jgi:hypothetical protein